MKKLPKILLGIGSIMAAIGTALVAQFDADPTTKPEWTAVSAAVVAASALIKSSLAKEDVTDKK